MADTVKIVCENTGKRLSVEMGASLLDVLKMVSIRNPHPFLAAYVNNEVRELNYKIFTPVSINFIDITHFEGMRVYQRTLFFILHKASTDLYPGRRLQIKHSVAKGFYCEIEGLEPSEAVVENLRRRMEEIVEQNIPIVWEKVLWNEAVEICEQYGFYDKIQLIRTRPHLYVKMYFLADLPGYFYGALAPSTGYTPLFGLQKYYHGIYLGVPCRTRPERLEDMIPQNKMFDIFQEYKNWGHILDVSTIGALNARILDGEISDLVKIAEAFHEKKLAYIADVIHEKHTQEGVKLILISGPSSSGKTTFSKRLDIQLRVLGLDPVMVSLDNYFVNREDTPLDEDGEHDFESLYALNIELFNEQLLQLMKGELVMVPRYDFMTGTSVPRSYSLQLQENPLMIIEGIHALNPELTHLVPEDTKYKIYTSAFTSISMDDLTRVPTTDNRLVRRIVRDYKYRNNSAEATIKRWQSVRRGEDRWIFPFQEQADVMYNSALFFELCILRNYAKPLLHEVPNTVPEYAEARRLLRFLDMFVPILDKEIPPTSILREFIGGGSFSYD